jgi:hypothetical protein
MHQPALDFDRPAERAPEVYRHVARQEFVLRRVAEHRGEFRPDFEDWVKANLHVWGRFEQEANAVWAAGRRHYSARTIGEVLRHETAMRAVGDEPFKLSDWWWPHLARLYAVMYPERVDLFEIRRRTK